MDSILFALTLILGGWVMYAIGFRHGFQQGEEKANSQVERRNYNRARMDWYYK